MQIKSIYLNAYAGVQQLCESTPSASSTFTSDLNNAEYNPLIISVTVAAVYCGKAPGFTPPGFRRGGMGRSKRVSMVQLSLLVHEEKQMSLTVRSHAQT